MKIHSDVLSYRDFLDAASWAHVNLVEFNVVGSRSRAKGFVVYLEGSSPFRNGHDAYYKAATWDEWGMFLGHLFKCDPNAFCGKRSYLNAEHFNWVTGNRFENLTHAIQHKRHKWNPQGTNATGVYAVAECDCGAIQRWFMSGYVWEDISILQLG